jgi:hypothetical protein
LKSTLDSLLEGARGDDVSSDAPLRQVLSAAVKETGHLPFSLDFESSVNGSSLVVKASL